MPRIDWSEEDSDLVWKAGAYEVEVLGAQEKTSKKGDPMISLRLGAVRYDMKHLAWDNCMCGGKGRGLGTMKLRALGVEKGTTEIDPASLVGKRLWAHVVEEEYQGKRRMSVAIDRGTHAGYSIEKPDVGVVEPEVPSNMGDDPFNTDPGAPFDHGGETDSVPF